MNYWMNFWWLFFAAIIIVWFLTQSIFFGAIERRINVNDFIIGNWFLNRKSFDAKFSKDFRDFTSISLNWKGYFPLDFRRVFHTLDSVARFYIHPYFLMNSISYSMYVDFGISVVKAIVKCVVVHGLFLLQNCFN